MFGFTDRRMIPNQFGNYTVVQEGHISTPIGNSWNSRPGWSPSWVATGANGVTVGVGPPESEVGTFRNYVAKYTTENGVWRDINLPNWSLSSRVGNVAFGDGEFRIVANTGSNVTLYSSPDGVMWTKISNFITSVDTDFFYPLLIAYGNGVWVITATTTTSIFDDYTVLTPQIMYSTGGPWLQAPKITYHASHMDLLFGFGVFISVGRWNQLGQGRGVICTSPDGSSWTTRLIQTHELRSLTLGSFGGVEKVYAGGALSSVNPPPMPDSSSISVILSSGDGINWSVMEEAQGRVLDRVRFGNGALMATGRGNRVAVCKDGTNWEYGGTVDGAEAVWDGELVFGPVRGSGVRIGRMGVG